MRAGGSPRTRGRGSPARPAAPGTRRGGGRRTGRARPRRPRTWRARCVAPPGAAPHLAQRRDGAREGHAQRRVEVADVDAELERVGGHDREQLALGQPPLDLAPLRRRVAGAVGRDPLGEVGAAGVLEAQAREALDQLHAAARLQEADRAHLALHQRRRAGSPPRPAPTRACPSFSSTSGGFHIAIWRSARGAPSRSTSSHLEPGQPLGELGGVGDRRAREHEARLGCRRRAPAAAAGAGRSPRASRTRRGRRAPRPPRPRRGWPARRPTSGGSGSTPTCSMSGFVRIRFERCADRRGAPRAACRRRRSRGAGSVPPSAREPARLVLGERLGRVEVEGAGRQVARERVEHGQVEGERLAARGPRGDDRVARGGRPRARRPGATRAPRSRPPASASRSAGWRSSGMRLGHARPARARGAVATSSSSRPRLRARRPRGSGV